MRDRFDLYGALYIFCAKYHSGQSSRGYRILSRLVTAGYRPGLTVQAGLFESKEQQVIYRRLLRRYKTTV